MESHCTWRRNMWANTIQAMDEKKKMREKQLSRAKHTRTQKEILQVNTSAECDIANEQRAKNMNNTSIVPSWIDLDT